MRRLPAILLALVTATAIAAPAGASPADCAFDDPVCFDALPPDAAWEQAIGTAGMSGRFDGMGVGVAVIDTGITPSADLGDRLLARVDLTSERDGIDRFGHGTHMAGIVASDGTRSQEVYAGVAPDADIVSVKVGGWDGATDVTTVIAGLEWAVANRDRYGIRVILLAYGTDATAPTLADPLVAAVERAWRAGLVVVVSAGNAGPLDGTLTRPGDSALPVVVGAADVAGTADPADDVVAPFSSRGPGRPDLLAPGVSIVSGRAPGSVADVFRPSARVGDDYFKGSGTSQAAAVVAGIAARIIQANPALEPDEVKGILLATADATLAGRAGGAGLVRADRAVDLAYRVARGRAEAPRANVGAAVSTGLGPIDGSRGGLHVFRDLDGDGIADEVSGEIDVLGRPWSATAFAAESWTPATWAASPWAPLAVETAGAAPVPAPVGPAAPLVAWEARYWGADSWSAAAWDARYWGARYWGARYWGTGLWQ